MTAAERMASMSREDLCAALQEGLDEMYDVAWEYGGKGLNREQVLDMWIHKAERTARLVAFANWSELGGESNE